MSNLGSRKSFLLYAFLLSTHEILIFLFWQKTVLHEIDSKNNSLNRLSNLFLMIRLAKSEIVLIYNTTLFNVSAMGNRKHSFQRSISLYRWNN